MSSVSSPDTASGSASRWGPLWGARPADWALSEDRQIPTYEAADRLAEKRLRAVGGLVRTWPQWPRKS